MEGKLSKGAGKREKLGSIFPPKICCLKTRVKPSKPTESLQEKTARKNRGETHHISVLLLLLLLLITCFYLGRRGEGGDPCTLAASSVVLEGPGVFDVVILVVAAAAGWVIVPLPLGALRR